MATAARAEDVRLSAIEAAAEAWLDLGDAHEARVRLEREAEAHLSRERLQALLARALPERAPGRCPPGRGPLPSGLGR